MNYVLLIFLVLAGSTWHTDSDKTTRFEPVAVIELFTSQGCSSCPAADRLLTKTLKESGKNIMALSFHVDYWNHLGWADPFSDKAYTKRQYAYAKQFNSRSVYTPQMVVNGKAQFVGSNEAALKKALNEATQRTPPANFTALSASPASGKVLKVRYQLEGDYQNCQVNFALVSKHETTAIQRGENGGRTLSSDNVVRQFVKVPAKSAGEVLLNDIDSGAIDLSVIAYVQKNDGLRIVGAAKAGIE
ncbi:DUF1223 domain-containing protein [Persicitalea jodogahamensis]|nr:DUF1223 domain-containing protein [Persicitalea jodogahamensis]